MLFFKLYKIMVNRVIFAGFREGDCPNRHPHGSAPVNPLNVNVFGDSCTVHQPRGTNVTTVEIKFTEMQEYRDPKKFYSMPLYT